MEVMGEMSWAKNQLHYERVCDIIDEIKTPTDFYRAMDLLKQYNTDLVNSVREAKKCYNSVQYT